jgi:F-type H+-transporting ATPase subunit b
MELLKLLNASEVVAQVVTFLLLLFLLRIFAWKKLLAVLDARKNRIASEFKKIEETKQEVAALRSDYQERLAKIEEIAGQKIEEALAQGKKITEEVRKKALEEAAEIIENAKVNIKYELAAAKEELKAKIVDLTISATQHIIREKLTSEDDNKLVEDFLKDVDQV